MAVSNADAISNIAAPIIGAKKNVNINRKGKGGKMTLKFFPYELKLQHVFTVATYTRTTTPDVQVEIEYEGVTGYGEASMPPYLGQTVESVTTFLQKVDLSQFKSPFLMDDILTYVDSLSPADSAAKAAIDIALHDLVGKLMGQPWYRIWGLDPAKTPNTTFTIGIVLVIITLLVILNLVNSRAGRAITAIRDNEIAARSVGIPITKYKLMAFVTSAVFAGVAGVLYALNYSSLVAKKFDYNTSILILVFVVLGGIGSLRGSVIAATVLTVLPELLRSMNDYRMLIYAIVLIVVMIFNQSPQMIALRKRLTARFRKEGTDTKAAKEKKGVA